MQLLCEEEGLLGIFVGDREKMDFFEEDLASRVVVGVGSDNDALVDQMLCEHERPIRNIFSRSAPAREAL